MVVGPDVVVEEALLDKAVVGVVVDVLDGSVADAVHVHAHDVAHRLVGEHVVAEIQAEQVLGEGLAVLVGLGRGEGQD